MTTGPTKMAAIVGLLHADGGCVDLDTLAAASGFPRKAVVMAVCKLVSGGFVERIEIGCYRLTDLGRQAAGDGYPFTPGPNGPLAQAAPRRPRRRTYRDRIWTAMRSLQKFTIADLLAMAGSEAARPERTNIDRYVGRLAAVGIIARLPVNDKTMSRTGAGFRRWRLARDLGPRAPICREAKGVVFDPNSGEAMPWKA